MMASSEDSTIEASCSAARSACLRSVMSRAIFETPIDSPARVVHRRHSQRHFDRAAVAAQPHGLVLVQPLAVAAAGEDFQFLVDAGRAGSAW